MFLATIVPASNCHTLALRNVKAAIGTADHGFGAVRLPFCIGSASDPLPAQQPIRDETQEKKKDELAHIANQSGVQDVIITVSFRLSSAGHETSGTTRLLPSEFSAT